MATSEEILEAAAKNAAYIQQLEALAKRLVNALHGWIDVQNHPELARYWQNARNKTEAALAEAKKAGIV